MRFFKISKFVLWAVFIVWVAAIVVAITLGIADPTHYPQQQYPPAGYPMP